MTSVQFSDEELIERCRTSDAKSRQTFAGILFARHYERVGRWCYRITGDRESAADMAQEVFAKAYRNLDSFQSNAKFSTWLYSIARHECLNHLSRRTSDQAEGGEEMVNELIDLSENVSDRMQREQTVATAQRLMVESLDETERVVFTLHYGDEMPLDAITRVLGLGNPSGAKAYIVSAKRKLSRAVARLRAKGAV